jgi:hypothetical protein
MSEQIKAEDSCVLVFFSNSSSLWVELVTALHKWLPAGHDSWPLEQ